MGMAPKIRCSFASPLTGACAALKSLIAKSFMDVSSGELVGKGVNVIVGGTGVRVGVLVGIRETVGVDRAEVGTIVGLGDVPLHPTSHRMTSINSTIVGANFLILMALILVSKITSSMCCDSPKNACPV